MAGARVELDATEALEGLTELLGRIADPEPAFAELGEHLLISTRERFDAQQAPDGTPWAPLSPRYAARKPKNEDKILVLDGFLLDLMRYQADASGLAFGTDRVYGAAHQFGRPEINLPAREFLGLSADDAEAAVEIFTDYVSGD